MQRRSFIFKVSLPQWHPGIRSGSSVFARRDLQALHASRALSWVFFLRSTMPSFAVIRYELYTVPCVIRRVPCWVLLRRPYFCCVFPSVFACLLQRRFPHAFRHLFPYACLSYIHFASLLFLVRFAIRCSKHFSRQNPVRIPRFPSDAFIRFLCIHPGHPTCFSIHYTVRSLWVFLYIPRALYFTVGSPCFLFVRFSVRLLCELQFTLFPMCFPLFLRAFPLICVHVFLYFHMNSLMVLWVLPAIVLVPSLFLSFLFIPHAFPSAFQNFGFIFS